MITKNKPIALVFSLVLLAIAACHKDQGNYDYKNIPAPVVTHLDSNYSVFVGDSLIIKPTITIPDDNNPDLSVKWVIKAPSIDSGEIDLVYEGAELHTVFGLGTGNYIMRISIQNNKNGMTYFYNSEVTGKTAFSVGTTVLTDDNGVTRLSFVKPNDSVQSNIYEAVNPSEELPSQPTQLLAAPQAYQPPIIRYWVFGKSGKNTGVRINANTFQKDITLADNFFTAPDEIHPQKMFVDPMGVISGVINGTVFHGTTSTWDQAPTYGMFDNGAAGDYVCSPEVVYNYTGIYGPGNYIGFDTVRQQFLRFNLYGTPTYFGTQYTVIADTIFNPANLKMSLVHLQQINGGICYAYCKNPKNDSLYELKFNAEFNGPFQITALSKRAFAHPDWINSATLWQATQSEIIYFTNKDKVYRYNPLNQDFRTVAADFGEQTVTMLKILDQNTLAVGVKGGIYYLNISTGQNGTLIKHLDGLPGNVIDMAVINNQ